MCWWTSCRTGRSAWSTVRSASAGGNYVPSVLGDRYDAFVWIDQTRALRPLHPLRIDTREPETYPSGV